MNLNIFLNKYKLTCYINLEIYLKSLNFHDIAYAHENEFFIEEKRFVFAKNLLLLIIFLFYSI